MSNNQQTSKTTSITMDARSIAAMCLAQIYRYGYSANIVLSEQLSSVSDSKQRALIQELFYGVLRWDLRLQAIAKLLLRKPVKPQDTDIYCLVLLGIYQLLYMRVPAHAAVDETVTAANGLGKPWARGLVNAILRRLQRDESSLIQKISSDREAVAAHPLWLLEQIEHYWPDHRQLIIDTNNSRPVMHLRVNVRHTSRDDYIDILNKANITSKPCPVVDSAVILDKTIEVAKLPHFADGWVSVQDSASQLAAHLLNPCAGQRILDACAAPGSKTCHILELQPELHELIAVDIDKQRLGRVEENLNRLGLRARIICGDAAKPEEWWDGENFDRILLDAPCSSTGVIRRHPDIKRLRRPEDIENLIDRQQKLINAMWPLLKTDSVLLYSTCSILPVENDQQMIKFLDTHKDAIEKKIEAEWGRSMRIGRQILPGENDMDGFYYACLYKH